MHQEWWKSDALPVTAHHHELNLESDEERQNSSALMAMLDGTHHELLVGVADGLLCQGLILK